MKMKFQISLTAQENKLILLPSVHSEWWVGILRRSESKTCSERKQPRFHGLTTEMLLVFRRRHPDVALEWPLCSNFNFTPRGRVALQTQFHCPFTLRNTIKQHTNIHIKENKLGKLLSPTYFSVTVRHEQRWHKTSLKKVCGLNWLSTLRATM